MAPREAAANWITGTLPPGLPVIDGRVEAANRKNPDSFCNNPITPVVMFRVSSRCLFRKQLGLVAPVIHCTVDATFRGGAVSSDLDQKRWKGEHFQID